MLKKIIWSNGAGETPNNFINPEVCTIYSAARSKFVLVPRKMGRGAAVAI